MKVYLSHSSEDRAAARELAAELTRAGLTVWSLDEVLPGDNWADSIARALETSDAMIVLLSPDSVRSEPIRREIEYALGSPRFEGRLIPVIVRPTDEVPWILKRLNVLQAQRGVKGVGRKIITQLRRSA